MLETPYHARSAKLSNIQSLLDLDGLPNMSCQDVVGWVSLCGRLSNNNTLANESNRLILPYAGKGEVKNSCYSSASSRAPYWRNRVMKMTKMHMFIPPSPSSISLLDILSTVTNTDHGAGVGI